MSGVASTLAKKRAEAAGFGTNAKAIRYLNQDFGTLRAQCQSSGKLFCDPMFPTVPESLGFKELGRNSFKIRGVTWKRPTVRTGPRGKRRPGIRIRFVWIFSSDGWVGRDGRGSCGLMRCGRGDLLRGGRRWQSTWGCMENN